VSSDSQCKRRTKENGFPAKSDPSLPTILLLTSLLLLAFALRVALLTEERFHADEALYAGWALRILDGDLFLLEVPVDKPPLYLHTLAASMRAFGRSEIAARLPNLAASTLGIALVYRLGSRLYTRRTGLWAALLLCLSPFDILFARTAFTDPMLVLWVLVACNAAVSDRWLWAGVAMGLCFGTKQHAIALVPLPALLGWGAHHQLTLPEGERNLREGAQRLLLAVAGFAIPFALVTWWDSARWEIRPGYWRQSALSYGGLAWADSSRWSARALEWGSWARYLVGSPLLYILLLAGTLALCAPWLARLAGPDRWRAARPAEALTPNGWADAVLAGYALAYVGFHTVLRFSVWDRYLLPLAPLGALLLARTVDRGLAWLDRGGAGPRLRALCLWAVVALALVAGGRAALNGYPVGGEHWAYQGLDRVVAYLGEHAAPDAAVYHHWLRWHYTFYLYDTGFELRWWESAEHLAQEARRTPEREQYLVLPDWGTLDPASEGVLLEPVYETQRRDGSTSFRVYRVRLAP
jgi:4-amino-4-deoxy-L-arabinose transferase-like glycosyltransferase